MSPFWIAMCAAEGVLATVAVTWGVRDIIVLLVKLTARYRTAKKTGDLKELTQIRAAVCDFIDGRTP